MKRTKNISVLLSILDAILYSKSSLGIRGDCLQSKTLLNTTFCWYWQDQALSASLWAKQLKAIPESTASIPLETEGKKREKKEQHGFSLKDERGCVSVIDPQCIGRW